MREVTLTVDQGIGEVMLNRPERKNAITGPLGIALAEALTSASNDPDVRVIILRGADGAFCSGLDLNAFNAEPAAEWLADFQDIWRQAHAAIFNCKKPIVGCLERYAINGGAALALACDLLIAGESAFVQVGEVQIGMAAPYNMAWLSLRHSESTIAKIALIGERLTSTQLNEYGITHNVVADDAVLAATRSLAAQLAAYPEGGLQRIKLGLRAHINQNADEWFDQFMQKDPIGNAPKPSSMKR